MIVAVKAVEEGNGLRASARSFGVPVETLRRRITGSVSIDCRSGPKPILMKEEEDHLSQYVLKMCEMGYGLGREDLMRLSTRLCSSVFTKRYVYM